MYFDEILIAGKNKAEHDARLRQVLERFAKAGVRLRLDKCEFYRSEVTYLGYVVSDKGLQPDPAKGLSIVNTSRPTDVQSLQSFLGLVHFYRRFISKSSELLFPLNQLLQKQAVWE